MLASAAAIAASAYALPVYEIYKLGQDVSWKPGLDLLGPYGGSVAIIPHCSNRDGDDELEDIHFTLPRGDFPAVVGVNGSGKTTLALLLTGLLRSRTGSIFVDGRDLTELSPRERVSRFGYVFQNPEHQFVTDTVEDEVAYSLRLQHRDPAEVQEIVNELLEEFGLTARRWTNPFSISQGEKRRLSVASMLALHQDVLILDEPTFGQDMQNAYAIMDRLAALHQDGRSIVLITHEMKLVVEYATTVLVLNRGQQVSHGPVRDLFIDADAVRAAGLDRPPMATVAELLRHRARGFPDLLSVGQFLQAVDSRDMAR